MQNKVLEDSYSEAEVIKQGREYFFQKDYSNAIRIYLIAVEHTTENSCIFSNLGICYYHTSDFEKSVTSCDKALSLDSRNMKALIFRSKSYARLSVPIIDRVYAIKASESIEQAYERSRLTEFSQYQESVISLRYNVSLLVIFKNKEWKTHKINSLKAYYSLLLNEDTMKTLDKYLQLPRRKPIPEGLICPITLDILIQATITPFGHSYERKFIQKYWKEKGYRDPVTRQTFNSLLILDNKNVNRASEEFCRQNPWVLPSSPRSYTELNF